MEKIISALVDGGKATAGPPIGPALGPMGINTGKVIAEINEKTKDFAGTTVPVKIIVNPATREYRIEIGTPSVAALIKKEMAIEKGSGKALEEKVGDIAIDQLIKVSRAKKDALLSRTPKAALKEIVGTCVALGVTIDGKEPKETLVDIDAGKYDAKIDGREKLREVTKEEIEKKKTAAKTKLDAKHKAEEAAKAAAEAAKAAATAEAAPAEGEKKETKAEKIAEAKAEAKKEEKK
jgi:large subunit ribosomal protein L11